VNLFPATSLCIAAAALIFLMGGTQQEQASKASAQLTADSEAATGIQNQTVSYLATPHVILYLH
jgi:hypothetical protein